MNKSNNILQHKTLSRLPQESGFYSGDCPGAAAITILSSLFSSLRGTLGRHPVSDSPSKGRAGLFPVGTPGRLIIYSLFPEKGKRPETTPGRVETTPGLRKMTHGRVKTAPGMKKMTHGRVETAPGRVEYAPGPLPARHSAISPYSLTAPYGGGRPERPEMGLIKGENNEHRISNNEYRIRKAEDGIRNLTSNDTSTSFLSPSHFGEGRGEANIKSGSILGNLVSDFLFLIIYFLFPEKGNIEHRIMNNESERKIPVRCTSPFYALSSATNIAGALHLGFQTAGTAIGETAAAPRNTLSGNRRICSCEYRALRKKVQSIETLKENIESGRRAEGILRKESYVPMAEDACLPDRQGSCNLTSNDTLTSFLSPFRRLADGWGETKYKTLSRLPQESGFNSGDCPGAAAITIFYSFYSSLRVSPNFAGTTQKSLPVINQPETSSFPWYCHPAGRYSGRGNSPHPERPLQRTIEERRYAYVLN
jgi:hypothetical protein